MALCKNWNFIHADLNRVCSYVIIEYDKYRSRGLFAWQSAKDDN